MLKTTLSHVYITSLSVFELSPRLYFMSGAVCVVYTVYTVDLCLLFKIATQNYWEITPKLYAHQNWNIHWAYRCFIWTQFYIDRFLLVIDAISLYFIARCKFVTFLVFVSMVKLVIVSKLLQLHVFLSWGTVVLGSPMCTVLFGAFALNQCWSFYKGEGLLSRSV